MRDAKLPIQYRDSCGHLLIPLNRCRFETWFMPWKCEVRFAPDCMPPKTGAEKRIWVVDEPQ